MPLSDLLVFIRPFAFLTIRHPTSRMPLWTNWLLPLFTVAAALALFAFLGDAVNVYAKDGLLERCLAFTQTLAGFYIAALAAVSSFNSPHLDRLMPGTPPTMSVFHNGGYQPVPLTRRRFLTSMFAYLTALSLTFSVVAIGAVVLAPVLKEAISSAVPYLHWIGFGLSLFALFQMVWVTLWGLFYLGERMLTPD